MFSTPDFQASQAEEEPAEDGAGGLATGEASLPAPPAASEAGPILADDADQVPRAERSDEQGQQSGQHKSAKQHGPIPGIEAQKPTVTREAQCGEPQHRDTFISLFGCAVGQPVMRY
jgi:hypothetical protein